MNTEKIHFNKIKYAYILLHQELSGKCRNFIIMPTIPRNIDFSTKLVCNCDNTHPNFYSYRKIQLY